MLSGIMTRGSTGIECETGVDTNFELLLGCSMLTICCCRFKVVGHDFGAALAWGLAIALPDRVEKLCVISVGHLGEPAYASSRRRDSPAVHRVQACRWPYPGYHLPSLDNSTGTDLMCRWQLTFFAIGPDNKRS